MTEEVFRDDTYARTCEAAVTAVAGDGIRLDRTVFYPTGGGQAGDSGLLRTLDGREITITEAVKDRASGDIVHLAAPGTDLPVPGDKVNVEIDWRRRHRLMRMHTCLHLLCAVVEGGVTGGSVSEAKGRLDFDLPDRTLDKQYIGAEIDRLIAEDHPVEARWISDDELTAHPELVRTMSVKPPLGLGRVRVIDIEGVDLQPCGGTHVRTTGEIGKVRMGKIENKGRHNRRVNVLFVE